MHDQRMMSQMGSKYDHPPALQPRHREVGRVILWWKTRLPGVTVVLAKRDVESAYNIIWLKVDDTGLFATELPYEPLGGTGNFLLTFLH